jgi:hypothetical protein
MGIIKYIKNDIIKSEEFDLEHLTNEVDISHLVYYLVMRKFEFDISYVNKKRNEMEMKFKITKKPNKKRNEKVLCDKEHPMCINDREDVQNYSILRIYDKPVIIDDYYTENFAMPNTVSSNDVYKDLLIERRAHYCKSDRRINHSFTASHPVFNDIILSEDKLRHYGTLYIEQSKLNVK